jgi:hypothetical protein
VRQGAHCVQVLRMATAHPEGLVYLLAGIAIVLTTLVLNRLLRRSGKKVSFDQAERWFVFAVAVALLLLAISPASGAQLQGRGCTASFAAFLDAFADSEALQRRHTAAPLTMMHQDKDAQPEPKPVVRRVRARDIPFPVVPPAAVRQHHALRFRIDSERAGKARVTMFKDDTDYMVKYFFDRGPCWRLVRVEDWSL